MAQVNEIGTSWNLPNYAGELFTASPSQTPLLSMIGGLTGSRQTDNYEFPTAVLYDFPEASQPSISETASATAPAASHSASLPFCMASGASRSLLLHSNATVRPRILPITSGVPRSQKTLPWILIAFDSGKELR